MAIKVEAVALGYYDNHLRNPGDVFEIKDKKELGKWMREVKGAKETPQADGKKEAAALS